MDKEKRGFHPCPDCGKGVLAFRSLSATADLLVIKCENCGRTVMREDFRELTDAWNDPEAKKSGMKGWFE